MNNNHRLVDEMMVYCGFSDGAGWANNLLIDTALKNGALGAKLTGAGGGGSVFALTRPGEEHRLAEAWAKAIDSAGLNNAAIGLPRVSTDGLVVRAE
jgi:mevalonate kinase